MILLRLPLALLLLIYQSMFLALGQIRTNKLRSLLTTIGIVIGIASVTAVIAALTGLKAKVVNTFESFGTNKMFINPEYPRNGRVRNINWRSFNFTPEQLDGLTTHCPSVRALTRQIEDQGIAQFGQHSEDACQIFAIDPDWHVIESRTVTLGRQFSLIDNDLGRAVCLINENLRQKLYLPQDPIGEAISIKGRRYVIVGIVETHNSENMFGGERNGAEVYVPFRTLWQPYRYRMNVIAACKSPELSDEAQAEIAFFLRHTRHVRLGEPDNFRIWVVQKELDEFNKLAGTMTAIAGGVVSISLLVGGVGIMNIMLVSVSERTREIGLRKAVGARPGAILLQFLVEAIMLCCLGGLFGVLGGEGLTKLISQIPNANLDKAYIPGWAIALSFGFSASVGLIFGMFPAIKAARLNPIDALRHE